LVDGSTVTYANFGANEDTDYEIGSITKTFTGLLLADAIERGEVVADAQLGTLLPLAGAPLADATLAELASHRSGLSAQGMQLDETIPFLLRLQMHRNPFVQDRDGVLAIARKATLTKRGDFVDSNLGTALLGHALAAAAHTDYVTLVQQRLLTPLGMSATSLPLTATDLPTEAPTGYSADGMAEAPRTINGWAPAGGARSSPRDMARFARALLDGSHRAWTR
jgi:CubicO group peptidase (beta-lactamase class C family)